MSELTKPYFVTIPNRAALHVAGAEAFAFLQNLISNDMNLLKTQSQIYAHLLTAQGKFLFDFIITTQSADHYILDAEGGPRAEELLKKLTLYRLRSKVELTLENDKDVYVSFNTDETPDPRHPQLGHRSFTKPDLPAQLFTVWDEQRIRLGVPDGSRDMVIEKSTLIESRVDVFNGISFTKGCYIGQEITARMHNRGLAKKHLITVQADSAPLPAPGTDLTNAQGHLIGEMRSSCNNIGLALIKDEAVETLPDIGLKAL